MNHRTEAQAWLRAADRELARGNDDLAERAICRAFKALEFARHEREQREGFHTSLVARLPAAAERVEPARIQMPCWEER